MGINHMREQAFNAYVGPPETALGLKTREDAWRPIRMPVYLNGLDTEPAMLIDDQAKNLASHPDTKVVHELQDMVAEIRRKVLALLRDAGIACIYSVSLGCLFAARQFWIDQTPNRGPRLPRLRATAEAVLRTSPYIILTGMLFGFLAIPLAAWAIGSASWGSLRRYIYVLWSVLALYIITCESADGLILISGAGLIALWLLRNAGLSIRSRTNLSTNMPLRILAADERSRSLLL